MKCIIGVRNFIIILCVVLKIWFVVNDSIHAIRVKSYIFTNKQKIEATEQFQSDLIIQDMMSTTVKYSGGSISQHV